MIVQVTNNIQVNTASNSYNNCHQFTRDVIVALAQNALLHPQLQRYIVSLIYPPSPNPNQRDNAQYTLTYNAMITNNDAIQFDKVTNPQPLDGSLIIFVNRQAISHSMIYLGVDTWIGANNLGSLGVDNNTSVPHIQSTMTSMDVRIYHNMQNRKDRKSVV